jgi:glycosyltransferase involved in cell wall biosynthesis
MHYHLRRGGVTSVLLNQAKMLAEAGYDILIISGEDADDKRLTFPHVVVKELQYDRYRSEFMETRQELSALIAANIMKVMVDRWGQAADIVHVHNPLIQKNDALISALKMLQQEGIRFLLQNHDLAEDFRPDVYISDEDYPENCHYGVINRRCFSFMRRAGLDAGGLHLLANEVVPITPTEGLERTRFLYPVRAIRRKNIGEALLISLFIPKGTTVAITLPPTTDKDEEIYRNWVNLAKELNLPVEFEAGLKTSFSELMGSSIAVLTTSVKEGFGFSYLEPWAAGRAVIGRRIDYVCRDFEDTGIQFDSLYAFIKIPMVYLSAPTLRQKMETALESTYKSFKLKTPHYIKNMMMDDIFTHDYFDFGRLDEELQAGLLRTLCANHVVLEDIAAVNPFLANLSRWTPNEDLIIQNKYHVENSYGRDHIFNILKQSYNQVMNHPVKHKISKSILLELFLDPLKMSLVGVGYE